MRHPQTGSMSDNREQAGPYAATADVANDKSTHRNHGTLLFFLYVFGSSIVWIAVGILDPVLREGRIPYSAPYLGLSLSFVVLMWALYRQTHSRLLALSLFFQGAQLAVMTYRLMTGGSFPVTGMPLHVSLLWAFVLFRLYHENQAVRVAFRILGSSALLFGLLPDSREFWDEHGLALLLAVRSIDLLALYTYCFWRLDLTSISVGQPPVARIET